MLKTLAAAVSLVALAAPAAAQDTILAGNLIADTREGAMGPATIIVNEGRIVSVTRGLDAPRQGQVYDLTGKTVMPGLIDLHVHLTGDPGGDFWKEAVEPDGWAVVVGLKNALTTVKAGFTTVRDTGSAQQTAFVLRRGVEEGVVTGPRIIASGPALSIVGGHGDVSGFRPEINHILNTGYTCTGATECAEKVRRASQNGADLIKITATGGVLSQQGRGLGAHFTDPELQAIADTAHSLGMKVAAHAHGARGIEAAAQAGIDTIEHGTFADAAALRAMKATGSYYVPTLTAFKGVSEGLEQGIYTPVVAEKIRMTMGEVGKPIRPAMRMGVKIAFGTDAGVFAHGRNAEEFALLVEAGMTPKQALVSATETAAEALGMEGQIGRIASGMSADLIAVDGDPYENVWVLENVGWVMARGAVVE